MNGLTKKQQAAYDYIVKLYNGKTPVFCHTYYKESWKQRGSVDGFPRDVLDALEKKGYVKLHKDAGRDVGIFNPKADSWGYSAYYCHVSAEPVIVRSDVTV